MSDAIRRAIQAMACAPDEPGWPEMSREQRTLSTFAYVMANADPAAMHRIIWDERDWTRARKFACLRDIGAEWIAKTILCLALGKPHMSAKTWLWRQCSRLKAEQENLWNNAVAYALLHNLLPLKIVR